MNRRKALNRILSVVAGTAASFVGLKLLKLNSTPELSELYNYKELITAISETIIPKSDSPSASECNVQDFVIKMVEECTSVLLQNKFLEGLEDLEKYAVTEYKSSFIDCSEYQRIQTLSHFEKRDSLMPGVTGKAQERIFGKSFFAILKEYVTIGYFTSEGGATIALRYSHIPTQYVGCENYSVGEKAWATY